MQSAVFTQSVFLADARLAQPQRSSSRAARGVSVALLSKTKAFKQAPAGAKVLVAGKDIKATQFQANLGVAKPTISLGFTASNELFVGRIAMLGVVAALVGEILTGAGPLAQLGYEFHESVFDVEAEILAVIAFNLIAAFLPAKGKFVADECELEERPKGPLQDPRISILEPTKFFGVEGFGFNKQNELFVGRMAQLGFAAGLIGEIITGKGILAQFGLETGIPLNQAEPLLLAFIAFTLFAAVNEGSGKFVEEEDS